MDYLTMAPSEYFHRNFCVTFEDDAIWPNSMPTLTRIMQGVPQPEIEQMCFKTATEMYRVDLSKLSAGS